MLGFAADAETVARDAAIGVNLGTMRRTASFITLENWAPRVALGAARTGTRWLDGELAYTVAVTGNAFSQTGGNAGALTDIFTGRSHEGAAATLDRFDLTAALGPADSKRPTRPQP